MEETYSGQHIFITGVTGFVGKVFLEKILRSLPKVSKMYLLVRPKKGVDPAQRLEKELLESPVMARVKEQYGEENFVQMWREKIVPVEGSLTDDYLGMSQTAYRTLVENVTMVFHLAATIDFNEKLRMSVILNVLGSLQILSLCRKAHQRGNFEAFIHVSTCYTNYALHGGMIEEKLYPLPFDAEAMTKTILNAQPGTLERDTPAMLKRYGFPNTYTMTKNISEHLLELNRGTVPMAIVRPSIIGSSLAEPFPGWVDTLSASGALFITSGFGLVKEVHADETCKADIVPVDFVVKGMLLAGAKVARESKADAASETSSLPASADAASPAAAAAAAATGAPLLPLTEGNLQKAGAALPRKQDFAHLSGREADGRSVATSLASLRQQKKPLQIYQVCTSGTDNPLTWKMVRDDVVAHWQKYPPKNQIRACHVDLIKNRAEYESKFHLKRKLPVMMYKASTKLPYPGARPTAAKNAAKLSKATGKAYDLVNQFRAFNNYTWDFMPTKGTALAEAVLSPAEHAAWSMDIHDISWHVYIAQYCYGIMKYVIKEEGVENPHVSHVAGSQLYTKANL